MFSLSPSTHSLHYRCNFHRLCMYIQYKAVHERHPPKDSEASFFLFNYQKIINILVVQFPMYLMLKWLKILVCVSGVISCVQPLRALIQMGHRFHAWVLFLLFSLVTIVLRIFSLLDGYNYKIIISCCAHVRLSRNCQNHFC